MRELATKDEAPGGGALDEAAGDEAPCRAAEAEAEAEAEVGDSEALATGDTGSGGKSRSRALAGVALGADDLGDITAAVLRGAAADAGCSCSRSIRCSSADTAAA